MSTILKQLEPSEADETYVTVIKHLVKKSFRFTNLFVRLFQRISLLAVLSPDFISEFPQFYS